MFITDLISITELARLTNKSRPTIYKYINDYNIGNFDEIPFSIIELFKMSSKCTRTEIITYCKKTYGYSSFSKDEKIQEIYSLIEKNKEKLNYEKLKAFILEEVKNDKWIKHKTYEAF